MAARPGAHEHRDLRQQDLRARRGQDVARRRCAIALRRHRGEPPDMGAIRQPLEQGGRKLRHRIGVGIDPGREIDERFGGVRKHLPRRGQIAAMRERLERRSGRAGVRSDEHRNHLTGLAGRSNTRLSGPRAAGRRSSGDVVGTDDRLARRHSEPRHEQRRSAQGCGVCCGLPDRLHPGRRGLRCRKLCFCCCRTAS